MSIIIAGKEYPFTTIQLGLRYNNLTELPHSIERLTNLTNLDIGRNELTHLPDFIGQLTNLTELYIGCNKLTLLPHSISQLTNLTQLNVSYNKLTHLPDSIKRLTNLTKLYINFNELTYLPHSIGQLTNLTNLNMDLNKLTHLPDSIGQLTNLTELYISNNKLTELPHSIERLTNLTKLHMSDNKLTYLPDSIKRLTNLTSLDMSHNKLTHLPDSIERLTNLTELYINNNKLTHLPIQLVNLTQCDMYYNNNPIEYIPLPLRRFLNRQKNVTTGVYNDTQNVHDHNIQESIKNSIYSIMNDKLTIDNDVVNQQIVEDNILKSGVKQQLSEYITDNQVHSNYQITFQELLNCVWQRITTHKDSNEIKKILNNEMQDGLCKCYTGRLSRLVNCLNGFYHDIQIKIHDNQQIGNIILLIKNKLETEEGINIEQWKKEVEKELIEREYKTEEIEEWLEFID
jgi:Leucine-rich repeat (LRR) protein